MSSGIVFDINEATIHDGPGLRTVVFLKGCPMRCAWCHSPEGQSPNIEIFNLPNGTKRICGKIYEAKELALYLKDCAYLTPEGGITFSGGEVLMQSEFMLEVLSYLTDINIIIETSGAGKKEDLLAMANHADLIYFGLKIIDPQISKKYTQISSKTIIENLLALDKYSKVKYILRIPLIPNAIATEANFKSIMDLSKQLNRLSGIEFLQVNPLAPAKYLSCNRVFPQEFASCKNGTIPPFFNPDVPFSILN